MKVSHITAPLMPVIYTNPLSEESERANSALRTPSLLPHPHTMCEYRIWAEILLINYANSH